MKKNIYFLLMALLVAMLSIGLSSCSKDDDDDGGSGGGSKAAVVDGKAYNMKYAWWKVDGSGKSKRLLTLEFSSIDIYNRDYIYAQPQIRAQSIDLEIGNWEYSDVQSGTYTGGLYFDDSEARGYSYETQEWQSIQHYTYLVGEVTVIITRDGDDYTITIPETMITSYDANTGKKAGSVPFSFTYKGKISVAGDWEN